MSYIAKTAIQLGGRDKPIAIGETLPDLPAPQVKDLFALGAIEEAPEGKAPAKAKAEKGGE